MSLTIDCYRLFDENNKFQKHVFQTMKKEYRQLSSLNAEDFIQHSETILEIIDEINFYFSSSFFILLPYAGVICISGIKTLKTKCEIAQFCEEQKDEDIESLYFNVCDEFVNKE